MSAYHQNYYSTGIPSPVYNRPQYPSPTAGYPQQHQLHQQQQPQYGGGSQYPSPVGNSQSQHYPSTNIPSYQNFSQQSSPVIQQQPPAAMGAGGVPAPLSNRQMSSKAKIERFIIRKSENSVILRDLSFFCTEQHLQSLVACYGECIKVHLCRSEEVNHRSLLHAFVELGSEEAVMNLIEELNGVLFMGRQMKIQRCQGQLSMQDMMSLKQNKYGIQVHVRFESLDDKAHGLITEERLREIFADCGAIEDAIVQRHSQNLWKQKGYGFIFFEEMESAERAVQTKNGIMFDNVYYQAAFTHKTKEKLSETGSNSVDYVAMESSYNPVTAALSYSRDDPSHYYHEGGKFTNPAFPTSTQPRERESIGSAGGGSSYGNQMQSSLYSRSIDTTTSSTTNSAESNGPSAQQKPQYSNFGAGNVYRQSSAEPVTYDDEYNNNGYYSSNNSTPQHPPFFTSKSQRAFSTSSVQQSDGYTTSDPSPASAYPSSSSFGNGFSDSEANFTAGIAAANKEVNAGGYQKGSPSLSAGYGEASLNHGASINVNF